MSALTSRIATVGLLVLAFVVFTLIVSADMLTALDHQVAAATHSIWNESLHLVFQAIAELGGLELTTVMMAGLALYLWRSGFGTDSLVVLVFVGAIALETLYKVAFYHPGPPHSLSHPDGPSITNLIEGSGLGNSFPSGHVVRTVVAYGLLAFVIRRLSLSPMVRATAVPVTVGIVLLVAFDRLYLDVHWESDVIGGLLLGAIFLVAGTVWLDRPRKAQN